MKPQFRIRRVNKGWIVEYKVVKWLFFTGWRHFVSVSGEEGVPWNHSNFDYAMMNLLNEVKWNTILNSNVTL